jgi:hypothetical protein
MALKFHGEHGQWTTMLDGVLYPVVHEECIKWHGEIGHYVERAESIPVSQRWLDHHDHIRRVRIVVLQKGDRVGRTLRREGYVDALWDVVSEVEFDGKTLRFDIRRRRTPR